MTTVKNIAVKGKALASNAGSVGALAALGVAGTALYVEWQARRAERTHPPRGRFIEVDGTRLHYVERGSGPAVVLLHGNTVSLEDFESSGLIAALASKHRVVAFDRPGFGHSTRPRDRLWTPAAQGRVLYQAMARLGLERPTLIGHSLGTVVALSMALDHPAEIASLVLLGGYYYPTLRLDSLAVAPAALPVLGDVLRHTVSALFARALLRTSAKAMFSPRDLPAVFFPTLSREMMLRPSQLRADAEDGVFMMSAAKANAKRYGALPMPVTIIAGAGDRIVDPDDHSVRLSRELEHARLIIKPGVGHMVHYATIADIVAAVEASPPVVSAHATADLSQNARETLGLETGELH